MGTRVFENSSTAISVLPNNQYQYRKEFLLQNNDTMCGHNNNLCRWVLAREFTLITVVW